MQTTSLPGWGVVFAKAETHEHGSWSAPACNEEQAQIARARERRGKLLLLDESCDGTQLFKHRAWMGLSQCYHVRHGDMLIRSCP